MTHTFAICAYGKSRYLEQCIRSLKKQDTPTGIILATSTPNDYIEHLCSKYSIPIFINTGATGITQDWNFAYQCAKTDIVTIAHQDDIYHPKYVEFLFKKIEKADNPILYFTDYSEIRDGEIVHNSSLLRIKRLMLFPLRFKIFQKSIFIRRRILSLGSPICCPSVSFIKKNCPAVVFQHDFRASEDWQAWEYLSRRKGEYVYCAKNLTYHRIHAESETSKVLNDNARNAEDYQMFLKFWPKPIAKALACLYSKSEQSNNLQS